MAGITPINFIGGDLTKVKKLQKSLEEYYKLRDTDGKLVHAFATRDEVIYSAIT